MRKEQVTFKYLKSFAEFILRHHLDDFAKVDLGNTQQADVPLLKYFKHLTPEQLLELSKKGVVEYFERIVDGTAVEHIEKSNNDWKADKLPGITRNQVVASDISMIYNARKHTLLEFLPKFTSDPLMIIVIVKEIENYYAFQEELSIQTFAEINKEEIQKSETRLKEAQNLAHLGYWDYDIEENQVTWSDELYKVYGLDEGTPITSERISQKILPEDIAPLMEKVKDIYTNGGSFTHEYRIRTTSGDMRTLVDKGYIENKPDGKRIIKGISQDITDRKIAEEKLLYREKQLVEAQALAHLGSWEWDTEKNLVHWSDEMYRVFGYFPREVQVNYDTYISHIHPDDKEMVQKYVQDCLKNFVPYTFETRIIRKDGKVRWVQSNGQVSKLFENKVMRVSGTTMDITERKLADEAIKQRQLALEASNKELEAFCYSISHDLRSPLRAIDGFGRKLANLYENTLDNEGKRLLNIVRSNAQQMGILIDCLLDFSRLNKKEIRKSPLYMGDVVQKVLQDYREQYPDHRAEVILGDLLPAPGDKDLISMVWHNLISNAIKFSGKKDHPIIEINSIHSDNEVIYSIKDNGAGFEMQYKDKLFGVFQRLHTNEEFTGTGVGLATVQRIIHRHGGSVWAESIPDQGATFYFSLPRLNEDKMNVISLQNGNNTDLIG